MKKISKLFWLLSVAFVFSQNIKAKKIYKLKKTFEHNVFDVSQDGEMIAEGYLDGTIKLWDRKTDKCVKTFKYYKKIHSIMFSPSGKSFLTLSKDEPVVLWDIATEKHLVCNHNDKHFLPMFSPNGEIMLTVYDNAVYLWDLQKYSLLKTLTISSDDRVRKAIFSPSGKSIFIFRSYFYEKASIFDPSKELQTVRYGVALRFNSPIHVSPDGTKILIFVADNSAKLYNVSSNDCLNCIKTFNKNSAIFSVVFFSDNRTMAFFTNNYPGSVITLFNLETCVSGATLSFDSRIKKTIFSSDKTRLLVVHENDLIQCYDIQKNNFHENHFVKLQIFKSDSELHSVEFSPNKTKIIATYADGTIRLLDVESGALQQKISYNNYNSDEDVYASFHPNNENLIFISSGKKIYLWEKKK